MRKMRSDLSNLVSKWNGYFLCNLTMKIWS
nr:MAG TPA: hypothetical protein [Caudoviricetes sp.]